MRTGGRERRQPLGRRYEKDPRLPLPAGNGVGEFRPLNVRPGHLVLGNEREEDRRLFRAGGGDKNPGRRNKETEAEERKHAVERLFDERSPIRVHEKIILRHRDAGVNGNPQIKN